ncbi:ArsR/SmtB family transcription factor [Actinomadura sp. 9N407]|uniref:ArsR/SmtB family transcription factor n=1 Tax=Actinomadura sp. 9N407 TaxID=3375154 RepID=UPI0037931335
MTEGGDDTLADRLALLEERVARLERPRPETGEPGPDIERGPDAEPGETFWALNALKERAGEQGAVLFTGTVTLPTEEHYEWQQGHSAGELLADDWSQAADTLSALAHPVRLLLLREILHGARTTAELAAHERLGTTGQLYHHLRQLVAAGWLRTTARGQYAVPGERVVPLLTVLAAARR